MPAGFPHLDLSKYRLRTVVRIGAKALAGEEKHMDCQVLVIPASIIMEFKGFMCKIINYETHFVDKLYSKNGEVSRENEG